MTGSRLELQSELFQGLQFWQAQNNAQIWALQSIFAHLAIGYLITDYPFTDYLFTDYLSQG